jgi:hypothetical protein
VKIAQLFSLRTIDEETDFRPVLSKSPNLSNRFPFRVDFRLKQFKRFSPIGDHDRNGSCHAHIAMFMFSFVLSRVQKGYVYSVKVALTTLSQSIVRRVGFSLPLKSSLHSKKTQSGSGTAVNSTMSP